ETIAAAVLAGDSYTFSHDQDEHFLESHCTYEGLDSANHFEETGSMRLKATATYVKRPDELRLVEDERSSDSNDETDIEHSLDLYQASSTVTAESNAVASPTSNYLP